MHNNSCSVLGNAGIYELPQGIEKGSTEAFSYLAGSQYFKINEMEVY